MRTPNIALELLDAGWEVESVTFAGISSGAPTMTVTLAAPAISLLSDDPQLAHLIARAMAGAKES